MMPDYRCYREEFGGKPVDEAEYEALCRASVDLLSAVCTEPLPMDDGDVMRAICYQIEMLVCQGGRDALGGRGVSSGITETLGDYSVGYRVGNGEMNRVMTIGGAPVSEIAIAILRRKGLTCRCLCGRRAGSVC